MYISIYDFFFNDKGRQIRQMNYESSILLKDEYLKPMYKESIKKHEKLVIDLIGLYIITPKFIEDTFAPMVKELKTVKVFDNITILSNKKDFKTVQLIEFYINKASKELRETERI